jgi:hypothetical protein
MLRNREKLAKTLAYHGKLFKEPVKMYRLELYNEQKIREHFGMVVRDTT